MSLILAIDLSSVFWRAAEVTGPETPLNTAMATSFETVRRIERQFPADTFVAICCDSKTNWRKKVDDGYKANRERKPDGFYQELERTKDRLRKDGYNVIEKEGYEADDVIASLCRACGDSPHTVLICSPDKDLLQLVGPTVKQLRTHEMFLPDGTSLKIWDDALVLDKFGVLPNKLKDWLALTGDASDNVPGIPQVGGKGAASIIAEFGSVNAMFSVIEACEKGGINPFEKRDAIKRWAKPLSEFFLGATSANEAIERIARNLILVGLESDVDIKLDEILKPRVMQDISQDGWNTKDQVKSETFADKMDTVAMPPEVDSTVEEATDTKAIAKVDPMSEFDKDLQPTGMHGLWWWLNRAITSRMYERFGTAERALMAVERGRDFGLSRSASLEKLQVIDGKVCPSADTLTAMVQRHPSCEYFYVKDVINDGEKSQATAVCCRLTRSGKPGPEQTFTYTYAMAKMAKLVKPNSGWEKNPGAMCVARATSWLSRWAFSDATTGAYSWEEMEGSNG